ncbi:unnamed protein product, partial [marine sediment metagenome]
MNKPELLVPLNNWKSVNSSLGVLKNADSVYFGLRSKYSMRARASNFPLDSIPKLAKLVHDAGKKIFLCTNIVLYDNELGDLQETLQFAKSSEIDAVICHDIAAMSMAKEIGMPFHISTQCNVSNVKTAKFYTEYGAQRINLSRELSLEQIKFIIDEISTPIE